MKSQDIEIQCGGVIVIFAVLHLQSDEKYKGIGRFLSDHGLLRPKVRTVQAPFGSFFVIEAVPSRKGVVWHKVAKTAGGEAARLLLPCGVRPPSGCGIKGYSDEEFRRRLLVNFVLELLKEGSRHRKLEVTLVDVAGQCTGVAAELIEQADCLRVLTLRPRRYDTCCAYCIQKYGAAPMIGEDPDVMRTASLILAPYGFLQTCLPPMDKMVFAQGSGRIGMMVPPEAVVLPKRYLEYMPTGISPSLFAAALHDSGRAGELAWLPPAYVELRGQKISLQEAVQKLFT